MYFEESGVFIGEVFLLMFEVMGIDYVVLGYSERREYFNEIDEVLNKKVKKVFEYNIILIFCCGEILE